ncbi:MAG: pyrF [Rickettsiales bacterium]|jgi:orotidine-5'-phosphate decarboxylase|nr:pyrF [Rickettsiales bacterium]
MITPKHQIICAIDTHDVEKALHLADQLQGHVDAIKLGLEFFVANGPDGVNRLSEKRIPIFLDLKLHDIPNTVAGGIRSAIKHTDVFMITIHASGGLAMMKSAVDAAEEAAWRLGKKRPLIVGVTALTSLDTQDLRDTGVIAPIADHILQLARLAKDAGLDGVVSPSYEVAEIKKQCGDGFKVVVPGIRPAGTDGEDQKRFTTPAEAVRCGADFIVVGRPITKAENPAASADSIRKEIAA